MSPANLMNESSFRQKAERPKVLEALAHPEETLPSSQLLYVAPIPPKNTRRSPEEVLAASQPIRREAN